MTIQFLNVDLEIESYQNLQPLVDAFGDDVINLYCGKTQEHYLATFEAPYSADADSLTNYFCDLVYALNDEPKGLWNTAFSKVFDIGYECSLEPKSYSSELRLGTLEKMAALGASIRVTIYPPSSD